MSPTSFTPDELNAAINTAARDMTSSAPSSELRARVMSRIDATPRWHWGWRLAIAGGAIGAVALTTAVMWDRGAAHVPRVVDVTTSAVSPETALPADFALSAPGVTVTVAMPQHATQTFVVSTSELEWRARVVPALSEPDALHVAPLQNTELVLVPLDITPLSVPPLASAASGVGGSK